MAQQKNTNFPNENFMRTNIFLIIQVLFLLSCNQSINDNTSNDAIKNKTKNVTNSFINSIEIKKIKLCKPTEIIIPVLDSSIYYALRCSLFIDRPISFIFDVYEDSSDITKIRVENNTEVFFYNYSNAKCLFYHKGYQFAYFGIERPDFITNMGKNKMITFFNPSKVKDIIIVQEKIFESQWEYYFEKNKWKCVSKNNCEEFIRNIE